MRKLTFYRPDNEDTRAQLGAWSLAEFAMELKLVNAVGPRSSVDSVAAMLRSGKSIHCMERSDTKYGNVPYKSNGKWKTWTHLLGYDTWQLLAMENDEMLMPELSADHFWRVLRGHQFTTPVLRHWSQPILDEMVSRKLVRILDGWNTKAAYCFFDSELLDKAVSKLIVLGKLPIERSAECGN